MREKDSQPSARSDVPSKLPLKHAGIDHMQ